MAEGGKEERLLLGLERFFHSGSHSKDSSGVCIQKTHSFASPLPFQDAKVV